MNAEQDLNEIMEELLQTEPHQTTPASSVKFIQHLKFKNTIYSHGDSVKLLDDQDQQRCFGKIIHIAKIPSLQFPVLLVAWYFHCQDPLLKEQGFSHLSLKELVLSGLVDWQYVESIKEKITVLEEKEYSQMAPYQRKEKGLFFCRSFLHTEPWLEVKPMPSRVCHCSCYFNPDEILERCLFCGILFHAKCSGRSDVCGACHSGR